MKSLTCVLMAVLTVAALPGAAQQPAKVKASPKGQDYFPLKVGAKWHYQADAGGGQKVQLVSQVAKIESIDGKPMARLEMLMQGNVSATEHLTTTDEGIFRARYNGVEVSPPLCILKFPIKEGSSWETQTKFGTQELKVSGRAGRGEEVDVPAGKYQTITVSIETPVKDSKVTTKYWFAPNVGIVKQTLDLGGKPINLELVKYEAGK